MKPIVGAMYDNEDQQASVQQDYSNWLSTVKTQSSGLFFLANFDKGLLFWILADFFCNFVV